MEPWVALDGRVANAAERAGVGRLCYELIRGFQSLENPSFRLRIYLDRPPRADFPALRKHSEIAVLPAGYFWTHLRLGKALRDTRPALFFSPTTQLPWGYKGPSVIVVPDLAYLSFPKHFTLRKRLSALVRAYHALPRATRVVAISQSTAAEIARHFPNCVNKTRVVALGCDYARFANVSDGERWSVRKKYGLETPFFLYLGRIQPRKNLVRLVQAFEIFCRSAYDLRHTLVLAGADGWKTSEIYRAISRSPVRDRIRRMEYVPEDELPDLIAAADAFVLLSLWEGFGLPVLEAMAAGTPVITSNVSALPEVADDAAVLVDPYDIEAIADALLQVVHDSALRAALIEKGRSRARAFSWENTVTNLTAVFSELLEGNAS